jgi:hypothetical protein
MSVHMWQMRNISFNAVYKTQATHSGSCYDQTFCLKTCLVFQHASSSECKCFEQNLEREKEKYSFCFEDTFLRKSCIFRENDTQLNGHARILTSPDLVLILSRHA